MTDVTLREVTVKGYFNREDVKSKFQELLGKRASSFMTSVLQIVSSNQDLSKADPVSVYQSAAIAATLDLPLNNSLGFAYIVPYNNRQADGTYKAVAQFQIGWKGLVQLGQRSGQYKTINTTDVRQGEIKKHDRLTGEIEFQWVEDEEERLKLPIIGYVSFFELLNGFQKMVYMPIAKLKEHALKYSKTYSSQKEYVRNKSLWTTDFDGMAKKTVLKLNIAKYGPLSIEMQKAVIADQAMINDADTDDVTYVDNDDVEINKEAERVALMIEDAKSLEELNAVAEHLQEGQMDLFNKKQAELSTSATSQATPKLKKIK